jgi:hypothetical protein
MRLSPNWNAELTPPQVEVVKDGMTAGKVQFTYKGYLGAIPDLTDEQKGQGPRFSETGPRTGHRRCQHGREVGHFQQVQRQDQQLAGGAGCGSEKKPKPPATQPEAK